MTTHKPVIKRQDDYFVVSCSACSWVGLDLRDTRDECKDDFTEHLGNLAIQAIRMNARMVPTSSQRPPQAPVSPRKDLEL